MLEAKESLCVTDDEHQFIIGDHLGSTSLVTNDEGTVISDTKYKAWGEVRYSSSDSPTKYTYTGQYSYASDFGLMFYNARWYDSSLGRFAQADSLVPGIQGIQAFDRYAYTNNNPIRYIDPSGHKICADNMCFDQSTKTKTGSICLPPITPPTPDAVVISASVSASIAGDIYRSYGIDIVITSDQVGVFTTNGGSYSLGEWLKYRTYPVIASRSLAKQSYTQTGDCFVGKNTLLAKTKCGCFLS